MGKIMYPVQVSKGTCGASIPPGWVIVEVSGNLFYVKEQKYTLEFLRTKAA